ncbi:PAAR domain-containing protein [Oscillochloris sp. ZM17-4]|uniref:PAAR domain-containing protein n=1 Tax=Oscillochloris sp. ZM17-4 TaxID=2866714 RepID=UPI001C738591|nr:PAAR domain-containing protein [Oscillochloris sp. ZM17-4]MBX0331259.1 PAAR domain-containing protein [Oscillochloris sp. ZM17-4]
MGQPAAKQGDKIVAVDIHIIMIPTPGGPVPTPLPHPFNGMISGGLSANVKIGGMPAATLGSTADNIPPHIPQGGPFQKPPTNKGTIIKGSATVMINKKPAARMGDTAMTCNDPADLPAGTVVAAGNVMIGG